jgi:hypothetical protein
MHTELFYRKVQIFVKKQTFEPALLVVFAL